MMQQKKLRIKNDVLANRYGLGKMITVLALLKYGVKDQQTDFYKLILILCLLSIIATWVRETSRFSNNLTLIIFYRFKS